MLLTRSQLAQYAHQSGASREKVATSVSYIISAIVNKIGGVEPIKDNLTLKHRGARLHLYEVKELLCALDIYNKIQTGKRYNTSFNKKIVDKLLIELKILHLNSTRVCMDASPNTHEIKKLERLLTKECSLELWEKADGKKMIFRGTPTLKKSHTITINDNRVRWVSSTRKKSEYFFPTIASATKWYKKHISLKIKLVEEKECKMK